MWNVVESTVGQIPITKVDIEKDKKPITTNEKLGKIEREVQELYDPDQMAGLPVGIQVVGGAWEEEKILGIMKIIEGCWEDSEDFVRPGSFLKQEGLMDAGGPGQMQ